MIFWAALIISALIATTATAWLTHLVIQHQKDQPQRVASFIQPRSLSAQECTYTPLTEPHDIFKAWYQALQDTQKEAWFTTYVWHVHQVDGKDWVTPHIYVLGKALCDLDDKLEQDVTVHFLINQNKVIMKKAYVQECWEQTMAMWRHMGFQGRHVTIDFRVWQHLSLNNIHSKYLVVDDKHCVLTSINIEQESYGGENTWIESGGWVTDSPAVCKNAVEFIQKHHEQASPLNESPNVTFKAGSLGAALPLEELSDPLPSVPSVKVWACNDPARKNIYHTNYEDSNITMELCRLIKQARHSIDIMTPTFNNRYVWDALVEACQLNPYLHVRILLGWDFNITNPFAQRHMLGYKLNKDFVKNKMKHSRITWKWYANDKGDKVTRVSGGMVHAKLVLIDDLMGKASSYNLDTWSALNSMESAFFYEDASTNVNQMYRKRLFNPMWQQGVAAEEPFQG